MILLSHPTGNQNVRQAALALAERDLLAEFWTCIAWNPDSAWSRLLPKLLAAELQRRSFPAALRHRTRTMPLREVARLAAVKLGLHRLTEHESDPLSIDRISRALDRRVARRVPRLPGLRAIYSYEDMAAESFRAAGSARHVARLYELPTGYWRAKQRLLEEEAEREPEWAMTLRGSLDSPAKLANKDAELALADAVFVASTFVKNTLADAPAKPSRVVMVPYGSPLPVPTEPASAPAGKLRVVYVGTLGQQKGISYLLKAMQILGKSVELTLVGRPAASNCPALKQAIKSHRWIPSLPHAQVLAEIAHHDVLVFPSLFDGFGLVILEAMAQGVPVITTPHTAGPDLIEDGADGYIVPIRSAEAIAEKLDLLAREPRLAADLGIAARQKARHFSWERYRTEWAAAIDEILNSRPGAL